MIVGSRRLGRGASLDDDSRVSPRPARKPSAIPTFADWLLDSGILGRGRPPLSTYSQAAKPDSGTQLLAGVGGGGFGLGRSPAECARNFVGPPYDGRGRSCRAERPHPRCRFVTDAVNKFLQNGQIAGKGNRVHGSPIIGATVAKRGGNTGDVDGSIHRSECPGRVSSRVLRPSNTASGTLTSLCMRAARGREPPSPPPAAFPTFALFAGVQPRYQSNARAWLARPTTDCRRSVHQPPKNFPLAAQSGRALEVSRAKQRVRFRSVWLELALSGAVLARRLGSHAFLQARFGQGPANDQGGRRPPVGCASAGIQRHVGTCSAIGRPSFFFFIFFFFFFFVLSSPRLADPNGRRGRRRVDGPSIRNTCCNRGPFRQFVCWGRLL